MPRLHRTKSGAMLIVWLAAIASLACQPEAYPISVSAPFDQIASAQSETPDAGANAFVRRAILAVWGRHPTSTTEIDVLSQALNSIDRPDLIRAMALTDEFVERWEPFIRDAIAAERIGARSNELCYLARSLGDPGPLLAEFVRQNGPGDAPFSTPFTMGDLIRSSLRYGDLSPVFRVHQFANLMNDYDLPDLAGAAAARQSRAEVFMRSHWNRRTQCLDCHNSEWSITASSDPESNRAWPVRGLFEKALFGDSRGTEIHRLRGFFRRRGVGAGVRYEDEPVDPSDDTLASIAPWGMSAACGQFYPPTEVWDDDLDQDSLLANRGGSRASVWDLEAILRNGFDGLRDGLDIDASGEVEATEAAAWLIAMHFTDRVVGEVLGARLTIDNDFPRTEAQRDLLAEWTNTFVASGFSLADLLVAITTSPVFNRPLPSAGQEVSEPFARIFDPWTGDNLPRTERSNGMGHRVHRLSGRMLLRSIQKTLDVTPLREFPLFTQAPESGLHAAIGVYLKEGQPGFNETTFESLLALEHAYGSCSDIQELNVCTFEHYLQSGGGTEEMRCEICAGATAACDWDARCCDVPWETYCTSECLSNAIDPGYDEVTPYRSTVTSTWIDRLLNAAGQTSGASLGDVVSAIKNRLFATTHITEDERALLKTILSSDLDTPYTPAHDDRLRRVCGALLTSPYFILGGHSGQAPAHAPRELRVAGPGDSPQEICEQIRTTVLTPDEWGCDGGALEAR